MDKKDLVALMRFNYGGRTLEIGDAFTAEGRDADLFVKLNRARVGKAEKAKDEDESEAPAVKAAAKGTGYNRRDMKAK